MILHTFLGLVSGHGQLHGMQPEQSGFNIGQQAYSDPISAVFCRRDSVIKHVGGSRISIVRVQCRISINQKSRVPEQKRVASSRLFRSLNPSYILNMPQGNRN